jgi:hypothetical protein
LWHQWANCTKKQEFNVLNELLQAYSRGPEAFSNCAPIVSAQLVQDLLNFSFVSDALDDIKSGIQPFLIADSSAEHRQANLELSRMYGLLNSAPTSGICNCPRPELCRSVSDGLGQSWITPSPK